MMRSWWRTRVPSSKRMDFMLALTVMLLIDVSNSLDFGTVKQLKKDMVTLVEVPEDAHVEGYVGDTLAFSATFFGENEDSTSLKQRSIS